MASSTLRKRKKAVSRDKEPKPPKGRRTAQKPSGGLLSILDARPPPLHRCSLHEAWPHLLVVFAALVAVYGYSAARTVVLEDDGEFIQAVYFLGVAHAPGYPIYVLLAHPFTWLPVGSVAWRVHLASGVFGAASCAVLWWIVRVLIPSRAIAHVAALSLGVSRMFWSQAIIAEVYTLNLLLFLLQLAFSLEYLRSGRPVLLHGIALLFGLALSNHWPLFGLACPCLALALWPAHKSILRQLPGALLPCLLLFALGLSPYLWMALRSQSSPEMSFYGALETWQQFESYVRRKMYAGADSKLTAGWWDKLQFSGFMVQEIVQQYTIVGAALAGLGMIVQWQQWKGSLALGLLSGFLGATFGLIVMLKFDYEYLYRAVFKVYPVIPYAIMALWLALGIDRVKSRICSWNARVGHISTIVLGGFLVPALFGMNWKYNNRSDYNFAKDYALTMLASFEPNATVFSVGDLDAYPLSYFHTVEGIRPDIHVLQSNGLQITPEGRIFNPHQSWTQKQERILQYVQTNDVPIYFVTHEPQSISDYDFGFYKQVDKSRENMSTSRLDKNLLALFRRIESYTDQTDQWTVVAKGMLIGRVAGLLTQVVHLNPDTNNADLHRSDLELASNHFHGMFRRILVVEKHGGATDDQLLDWVKRCEQLLDDTVSKQIAGKLYELKGRILKKMGHENDALRAFEQSVKAYPHPKNVAIELSRQLRMQI